MFEPCLHDYLIYQEKFSSAYYDILNIIRKYYPFVDHLPLDCHTRPCIMKKIDDFFYLGVDVQSFTCWVFFDDEY